MDQIRRIGQVLFGTILFGLVFYLPIQAEEVEPTGVETVEVAEQTETEPMVEPEEPEVEPISEPEPEVLNGWQEENTKYYIDGMAVDGVQTIDKDVYYFENETLNPYTGFVKNTNNKWIFVRDGKSDWTFTGVAKSKENGKWYHADKGVLNWNFTGISKSVENGKWYFSRKGALDWSFTGVAKSVENGKWYHARKGVLDWNFTGVSKSVENGRWYHSKNGRLDWSFTGISKSVENGKWYFSRKGALDWNFTGVAKSIQNGKWYHVKKGCLDWKYTGLGKSVENGKLYYCKNGSLDWNKTGYYLDNNGNVYRIKNGRASYHSNLRKDIQAIFNQVFGNNKNVAAGLYDLTNGMKLEINNAKMPSASVIKLYIAGAVYEKFGNVSASVESNLSAMLLYSDNNAANALITLLGNGNPQKGFSVVNQYCSKHGYSKTHLGRMLLAPNYYDDNYTSVGDCGKFVGDVYAGRIAGAGKILNYMKHQHFRTKIPAGIPQGILVGNKTGEVAGVENDVAIIYGRGRTYVLSVMSKGVASSASAQAAIREFSRRVYYYWN